MLNIYVKDIDAPDSEARLVTNDKKVCMAPCHLASHIWALARLSLSLSCAAEAHERLVGSVSKWGPSPDVARALVHSLKFLLLDVTRPWARA